MDSPHLPGLDEHPGLTPHLVTTSTSTASQSAHPALSSASANHPPSPSAIAAAVTLATLADNRPPTSDGEDEEEVEDDDHSGGISLFDFDSFLEGPGSTAYTAEEFGGATAQLQTAMAQFDFWPQPMHSSALDALDTLDPLSALSMFISQPAEPQIFLGHLSSSEHPLEPPATLQEVHLSIQDRTSFAPITTFFHCIAPEKPTVPGLDLIQVPSSIVREDLQGDRYDYQGIDWVVRNTTRSLIRAKRFEYEAEKLSPKLKEVRKWIPPTPATDTFFQFKRNNTSHRAFFPHFQLRNVLAATSQSDIFYAAGHKVFRTDAEGTPAEVITNLSRRLASDGSITTIASTDDVLIAGAFEGEYAITNLSSTYGTPCTFGRTADFTADTRSRIVNHLHLFESRTTHTPQAVLCSNDNRLRILDCMTNTFTHSFSYSAAVNCSATSPDGRMRVVVGDFQETLITNAETGQPFETLNSHTDDAFACAWADDGIHIATAAQDSTIVIWDARRWDKPLTVLASELSVPRSLRFSPVGSGPRVLVAAEADDYINVINAQTFESKQVFEFFGPIGGFTFTPNGQSLFVANGERRFGGIVELDRTGWAQKCAPQYSWENAEWEERMTDWIHDDVLDDNSRASGSTMERERRHIDMSQLIV